MENPRKGGDKSNTIKSRFSRFAPIIAGALFFINPSGAEAQNTSNQTRNKAEISTSTILDRLDKKLGVSLPDEFRNKVLDFVLNDTIMRTRSATDYTEEFLINIMKKNPGISEENRLLFNRSSIYGGISQKFLYDRLDDENEFRANEYEKALNQINETYEEYKKGFKTYMETGIAELDKQSAELDKQSAKNREIIEKNIKKRFMEDVPGFYQKYITNPKVITQNDIDFMKKSTKSFVDDCEKYGHDYKALMLEAVGDKRKVEEMLKFYGVE